MEEKKAEILCEYLKEEEVKPLPWPFENISLEQIIKISRRINVSYFNDGNTYELRVNGIGVKTGEYKDNFETMVLSYIKFIGYSLNDLVKKDKVKPGVNVHDYVIEIMKRMEDLVNKNSKYGNRTYPGMIHDCLEWGYKDFNHSKMKLVLYEVIELLGYHLGYSVSNDGMRVVPTKPVEAVKVSNLAYNAQSILKVSEAEVISIIRNQSKTASTDRISFDEWISRNFQPYNPEILTKKKTDNN